MDRQESVKGGGYTYLVFFCFVRHRTHMSDPSLSLRAQSPLPDWSYTHAHARARSHTFPLRALIGGSRTPHAGCVRKLYYNHLLIIYSLYSDSRHDAVVKTSFNLHCDKQCVFKLLLKLYYRLYSLTHSP